MRHHTLIAAMVAAVGIASVANALPDDRTVYYAIHQDPTNSSSRVQYYLSLEISAVEEDGDWIGWEIGSFAIIENVALGSDTVWAVDYPDVGTPDGLWWVEHADPEAPARTDFVELAPVSDTAIAADPNDDDLEFEVEGVPYTAPAGGAPYTVTAALNFAFSTTADPDDPPDDSGDDEPVDSPDLPHDPGKVAKE